MSVMTRFTGHDCHKDNTNLLKDENSIIYEIENSIIYDLHIWAWWILSINWQFTRNFCYKVNNKFDKYITIELKIQLVNLSKWT